MRVLRMFGRVLGSALRVACFRRGEPSLEADGSPRYRYLWQMAGEAAPLRLMQLQRTEGEEGEPPAEVFIPLGRLVAVDDASASACYHAPLALRFTPGSLSIPLTGPELGMATATVHWHGPAGPDWLAQFAGKEE